MTDLECLMDRISLETLAVRLRDRAVIALLLMHTSATVAGIVAMRVRDYYALGDSRWVRLMTNGVERVEPLDPRLQTYIDEYLAVVRIQKDANDPLFRHCRRDGSVTPDPLSAAYICRLVQRRVRSAARRSETGSDAMLPRQIPINAIRV